MKHYLLPLSVAVSLLASCSNFIGGYSARSHEHLTSLKAHHIKLIDDNTKSSSTPKKVFSASKFSESVEAGELKFREASEYSRSLNDDLRTENIQLLHEIYHEDTSNISKKARLLTLPEAEMLKAPTASAYDIAIKGEQVRKSE